MYEWVYNTLGIPKPKALNQYQSPVNTGSSVPMASNVAPMVRQPVALQNAPKAAVTSQAATNDVPWTQDRSVGEALMGLGKGLLSKGWLDSPLAAGILGATDGYVKGKGDTDERMVRAELEAAYQTGDQGKIALARSKYQALPNYNKDVLAGLEVARNESISGIKQETGYVYNPATGKNEYRDPNGDLKYQAQKVTDIGAATTDVQVDATTKIGEAQTNVDANKQRVVGDIEVEQALKKSKSMGDYEFEQWKVKNKTEYDQQFALQKSSLEGGAAKQETAIVNAETRAQQQTAKPLYNKAVEQIASIDAGIAANTEAMALAADLPSNAMQSLSDFVSPVIGSDAYDKVQAYKSVIGKAALALHTGGVMTDKDYERYVEMAGNPKASPLALQQMISDNIDRSKAIKAQMEAQRDTYGTVLGFNKTSDPSNTSTPATPPPATKQSDSGGNTSVSGSSW